MAGYIPPRLFWTICLTAAFLLPSLPPAPALCEPTSRTITEAVENEPVVTTISIVIPGDFKNSTMFTAMARDLIFMKEGDLFSAEVMEQSIRALRLSNRFASIVIDSEETDGAIALLFTLTPVPLVRDIRMRGIYPFFEKDLRNVMAIGPGDPVTSGDITEQERLVRDFLRDEGYIDPTIVIEAEGLPRDGFLSLRLTVDKGPSYRLEQLSIQGNYSFGEFYLRNMMHVQRNRFLPGQAGRFIERHLVEDVRNLLRRYRDKGFAECSIDSEVRKDSISGAVSVALIIREGPRYDVRVIGNQAFPEGELEDDFIFLREGNRNDVALNRSVRLMMNRYRSQGYPDVRIEMGSETYGDKGGDVRVIRFIIDEGSAHRIGALGISGNSIIEESAIQGWLQQGLPELREGRAYVQDRMDSALVTIAAACRALGFLGAEVHQETAWRDDVNQKTADVTFCLSEGVQTMVSSVSFTDFYAISEEEARRATALREGSPLLSHVLVEDRRTLAALISERGYPHGQVREFLSFNDDRSMVAVEYRADEGPPVTTGNVYITGNFKTKERVLLRALDMRPGDPFSAAAYLRGERNIRNLDILESARFRAIGIAEKAEEITVLVDVAEKKPYYLEAGLGYESQRGLYVDGKAGDRNLFGANRSALIGSEVSETGYRNEASLTDPRFLGYSLSATMSLYQDRLELFNQPFGTDTYGASLKFTKKLLPDLQGRLGFRFEQKELFDRGGAMTPGAEELFNARSITVVTPAISYDSRDNFIRPRQGVYSGFSIDVSKGIRNSLDDFLKYDLDLRYFRSPFSRLTLAFLGRAALLQSFGSSGTIPEDQLLFLGSISNVRGFAENMLRYDQAGRPLGGRLSLAGSVEARIDLGGTFELITFYDTGSISRTFDNFGSDGFRSTLGAGLLYITPIGPMGILYGRKIDRREGEGAGRWHFSIGYTF